jgi:CBS domain-containing protein
MRVADVMQRSVKTIGGEATIAEAILTLADEHISGLPVVDDGGRLIGVVSSTDVLVAEAEKDDAAARQRLIEGTAVREIMTPHPYTIEAHRDLHEAAQQMLYADVHRLFVTEGDRLIGVISTTDIVRAVANGSARLG